MGICYFICTSTLFWHNWYHIHSVIYLQRCHEIWEYFSSHYHWKISLKIKLVLNGLKFLYYPSTSRSSQAFPVAKYSVSYVSVFRFIIKSSCPILSSSGSYRNNVMNHANKNLLYYWTFYKYISICEGFSLHKQHGHCQNIKSLRSNLLLCLVKVPMPFNQKM